MSWLKRAAFAPHLCLCSGSALEGRLVEALQGQPGFADEDGDDEAISREGDGDDDADGFSRESPGDTIDRPRDERPMTTKRLYTTRRTNQSAAAGSQQLAKLKLAALGAAVLLAVLAVAFRGKFANDDDDDDS
ncbi:hypothetical protein ACSSS7_004627 [Eimeria intestinalis]